MLDIKSKSSKSKYIINGAIFLLLIILSVGMYSAYPFIKGAAKEYEHNIFEQKRFLSNLNHSNYVIYFETLKNKENTNLRPWDALINKEKSYNEHAEEDKEYVKEEVDRYIYMNQEILDSDLKNLDYFAINKEGQLIKERTEEKIEVLLADNPDRGMVEHLNNIYDFYIVIDYNEKYQKHP